MGLQNSTRGVSFDPKQAAYERERALAIKEAQDREAGRKMHQERMREYGRVLDQIETCYRQYTPPQIENAEAMQDADETWRLSCFDTLVDAS